MKEEVLRNFENVRILTLRGILTPLGMLADLLNERSLWLADNNDISSKWDKTFEHLCLVGCVIYDPHQLL